MSFSGDIKEELLHVSGSSRHCQLAELAAYVRFCGRATESENGRERFRLQTENQIVARQCFTLLKKTFKIYVDVTTRRSRGAGGSIT